MKYSIAAATTLMSALAFAAVASAQTKDPDMGGKEKCFGVAKAGKNDCAAGAHSCAGQATKDGDKSSFIVLPAGVCSRLAGSAMMAGK